jgi:predicted branched-subunit amino acid permease
MGPVAAPAPTATRRRAVADALPLFLPVVPFGFVVGLAATESVMPTGIAFLSSPLMFAGAAQLALITLVGSASLWAAAAAALVINARHLMYSAALAPSFRGQPRWFRWLGPYLLVDQTFALVTLRAAADPAEFRRYYLTVGLVFAAGWQVATALGLVVGPAIPASWALDFAPAVMFCGIVVLGVRDRAGVVAAIVGASVSGLTVGLENRLGLLVGAVAGVAAGTAVDAAAESRR